ncbi:MAG: FAD-binding oxidoreductase, partial [Methanobacteriota archaeon]
MPLGVVLPRVIEEVHATVELASKFGIPLLARTSGSSLAGQAVNEAVVIDMTRHLDKILEINEEERWVRVMPGIVLDELNLSLKKHGLKFGPDPASSNRAAMGGIVSNNSTGAHSILYGMTADHVLECKGFFSDGSPFHFYPLSPEELFYKQKLNTFEGEVYRQLYELVSQHSETIRKHTPRYWRRCGGYNLDRLLQDGVSYKYPQEPQFNLAKLISGAEGTLAIMSEIKLNLVTPPKKTALALVQFNTLHEALTSVPVMLEVNPSAIELIDNLGLTLCKEVPEYARLLATFMTGNPNCILVTEFYGETETELKHHIEKLKTVLKNNNIHCEVVTALDPQMQQNVWTVRKVGLGLLMSIKGDYKPIPFIEDAAVPPEHLAEYIARIEKFCNELGTRVAYYAHASAGCLHVRPLINTKVASDIKKLPEIATFSAELVAQYGGALSSEHGDGRCRSWLNEKFYGPELFALYKQVKRIFDPHNILNPGNIVDFHSMTENLRYGENYQSLPINTHLDFSSEQGFDRAIEMCNGAAVCRKRTEGTMCPSFMVTREEEHSTRGRANMLRAVLSGRLPAEELTGKRMFQVMDLCVECKGCKAECPSSVDMAKIKFEFLAQYYHKHPIPLRTRLFANIPALSRMASGLQAPIINFIMNATPTRFLMQLFLGISRFRTFPEFARESFSSWYGKNRTLSHPQADKKQVVLLADTFNNYQHPPTLRAALELLEHLGYEVILPSHGCCGRPSISKGLVNKARKFASGTVSALKPFIEAGIP